MQRRANPPPREKRDPVVTNLDADTRDYSRCIYFGGLILALLFILFQLYAYRTAHLGFCDSQVPEGKGGLAQHLNCLPCPKGATCKGGEATCPQGQYLFKGTACKPDENFRREKDFLFGKLRDILAEEAGLGSPFASRFMPLCSPFSCLIPVT